MVRSPRRQHLRPSPGDAYLHGAALTNAGVAVARAPGRAAEGARLFRLALRFQPQNADAARNLAALLNSKPLRRFEEAARAYAEASWGALLERI